MTSGDPQPGLEYEGDGAALELAMWSLDEQLQTIKDIDAKAERALTLAVAILALFSGASTFQWGEVGDRWWLVAAVAAVTGVFLITVVLYFRCQAFANLYLGPDSDRLLRVSAGHADARTRQWMAEAILRSVDANAGPIQAKNSRYKRLAAAVIVEAVAASVTVASIAMV